MSKARIAAVSPLLVACLCAVLKQAPALLAAAAFVGCLVVVLVRIQTGMDWRRGRERAALHRQRFLRCALPGALVMLLPSLGWATFPTSFVGVTVPLSTGVLNLSGPWAVAVDSQGNVFIADTLNARVVEVTAAGVASVVSFPGLSPVLGNPSAVAVDGSGNLYVADSGVPRVVELSGGVATVVPTSSLLSFPSGLALDAAGDLFIADRIRDYIVRVPAGGAAAVFPITGVALGQPWGLAADVSGNLYIADKPLNRIVVVTPGGAGSVLAIVGGLTLNQPTGVAADGLGNVYIGDSGNNRVVTVNSSGNPRVLNTGDITPVDPRGVAVSVMGAVYFADSGNNQVVYAQPTTVNFGHLPLGAGTGTTLVLPFTIGFGVTFGSEQVLTQGIGGLDFATASTTCVSGRRATRCVRLP
jgi:sugar lactone lactonase YvrE